MRVNAVNMEYSEPLVETWTLYGCGSLLILLRLMCRWRMVGLRGFDPDDYMVGFSWVRLPTNYRNADTLCFNRFHGQPTYLPDLLTYLLDVRRFTRS